MAASGVSRTQRQMLDALTGLRALASAWVVLYHFRDDIKDLAPSLDVVFPLLDAGYAGVDVFFVLSGFIITYTYLSRLSHPNGRESARFLWFRLARLYPVHLFTLLIFAVIIVPGGAREATFSAVWANLTSGDFYRQLLLVHAWGTNGNIAWNYPAWSISSEWFAYLLFPLAALGLVRVATSHQAIAGFVASNAFNILTFILIAAIGMQGEIILVRIIGEFAAGCFLYLLWRHRYGFELPWHILTPALFAAAGITTIWVAVYSDIAPVVAAPLYGAVIYGLAIERDILSRGLATRMMIYGGEVSYSLYMTHALVQRFTWEYLPAGDFVDDGRWTRLAVLVTYAGLLAFTAALTYHVIERPGREWMRRLATWAPRLRPSSSPTAAVRAEEPVQPGPGAGV